MIPRIRPSLALRNLPRARLTSLAQPRQSSISARATPPLALTPAPSLQAPRLISGGAASIPGARVSRGVRRLATATETPASTSPSLSQAQLFPPIVLPSTPLMSNPFPPVPPIPKADGPVTLHLPPTDDRIHKYFTLDNGIEVIVVSDPKADKAAAAMDVGVGHLSDPEDLPGCAHFCEHLLFMGTKTFPSENEYASYLSKNNGHSNAWTAMTSTTYFFDVGADALEGALDRFSGFFYEPLFNEDCTEREIKAVDSEHKKNLQNDMWRFFQMEKHVFREDHAYHKFGTGNYESLWSKPKANGKDPRQQLIEWWKHYYCARRMKLAVNGREDVETLEKWVRNRFEKVPIRSEGAPPVGQEGVRIAFDESPMGPEQMGVITFAKPVKDNRGLEITFPFPDLTHLFKSKPTNYITHFLGHEGKGSILSYLKAKGWTNYLRAGMAHGVAGFDFFKVTVDLTPDGLQHWNDVALAIFKYISLLRSAPPSSMIFDDLKQMAEISFRFAEKHKPDMYCVELTAGMQDPVPRDRIISAKWLIEEFRQDELESTLLYLDPRKAAIGVTSRELPKGVEGTFDQREPIYGTEYKRVKVSEEFMKEAMTGAVPADLKLPGPNPFIPKELDVAKFDVSAPALRPELLRNSPLSRLWYKRDDTFWLPKANVDARLVSPLFTTSPRNTVLTALLCEVFSDSITEDVYDAELAELNFRVYAAGEYIGVSARGFSDKLAVLAERMLTKLVDVQIDEERFKEIVDQLKLMWENFKLVDPYRQAGFFDSYATSETAWTQAERLAELEHVTPADVKAFAKEVFQRLHIETLIHGNTSPERIYAIYGPELMLQGAKAMQDMFERVLSPRALTEAEKNAGRTLLVPRGNYIISLPHTNPAEVNNGVIYHVQIGDITDQTLRARLQLFEQIVHEPAFDQLRTKEQLGYIVQTSITTRTGAMGWKVLVQSERDAVHVESRIEAFLNQTKGLIEGLTDEEFDRHRQSLIAKREEKPKNLGDETKRFWGRILDRYYEFGKRQTEIEQLRTTSKADVIDLLETLILPTAPSRSKLSTHIKSQYKGIKFDMASAQPLVGGFMKHGVVVDQAAMGALMSSSPDLQKVKDFALAAVDKAQGLAEAAAHELRGIIQGLKGKEVGSESQSGSADGAGEQAKVAEGTVWIKSQEELLRFKASLKGSASAVPIEPIEVTPKL